MARWVKNLSANAGDIGDKSLTLGSGILPGEGNGNPLQYSFMLEKIPWTEEPGGPQCTGLQRVGHHEATKMHTGHEENRGVKGSRRKENLG